MERYNKESLCVGGADERMIVSGFVDGIRQLNEELKNIIPKPCRRPWKNPRHS
jgi:hypothetical protein